MAGSLSRGWRHGCSPKKAETSACGVGSQSAEDADLEDALGEWDDAEEELYLARLSQWESRQHLLNVADIVPGQVSHGGEVREQAQQGVTALDTSLFCAIFPCTSAMTFPAIL